LCLPKKPSVGKDIAQFCMLKIVETVISREKSICSWNRSPLCHLGTLKYRPRLEKRRLDNCLCSPKIGNFRLLFGKHQYEQVERLFNRSDVEHNNAADSGREGELIVSFYQKTGCKNPLNVFGYQV
jgi:hypothetical protein